MKDKAQAEFEKSTALKSMQSGAQVIGSAAQGFRTLVRDFLLILDDLPGPIGRCSTSVLLQLRKGLHFRLRILGTSQCSIGLREEEVDRRFVRAGLHGGLKIRQSILVAIQLQQGTCTVYASLGERRTGR